MKKKSLANFLMVLLIGAIVLGGIALALRMRSQVPADLGSLFATPQIPQDSLIDPQQEGRCTITIVCGSVLKHLDSLVPAKSPYVPEDGVILPEVTVSFAPGDTVFSVLQKVCDAGQIPLEYSWTPLYDSYYVEGIAHLYEFDCGAQSGWMYQVNGAFPNYGCSGYALTGGEAIVWCYTCAGLGTDIPPV